MSSTRNLRDFFKRNKEPKTEQKENSVKEKISLDTLKKLSSELSDTVKEKADVLSDTVREKADLLSDTVKEKADLKSIGESLKSVKDNLTGAIASEKAEHPEETDEKDAGSNEMKVEPKIIDVEELSAEEEIQRILEAELHSLKLDELNEEENMPVKTIELPGIKRGPSSRQKVSASIENTEEKNMTGRITPVKGVTGKLDPVKGATGKINLAKGATGRLDSVKGATGKIGPVKGATGRIEPVKGATGKIDLKSGLTGKFAAVKGSTEKLPSLKEKAPDTTAPVAASGVIKEEIENQLDARDKKRRDEKQKRKKIRLTALLIILFIGVLSMGVALIYKIRGNSFDTIDHPYDVVAEFSNPMISGSHQRSDAFASTLCVVDRDVALESSLLDSYQKGLLFDLGSKEVLFSQGAFEKVYPASITKIMTAMLALKYGKMNDMVVITQENVTLEEGSQVCGFRAGDTLNLEQLLNCLLVYSGNDAASAIAEHIGGTTEQFVSMMNEYAHELGCSGTHFTNPHGLQDENHYTTPYDIYLMLKEALNYPEFTAITKQSSYTVNYVRDDGTQMSTYLLATDHYLTGEANAPKNVTVLGGKTGTTSLAGNCLALLCQDAYGKPYCSIVMGAGTKDLLYEQMNSILQAIQ